jgi:hypothetical protein
MKYSSKHKLLHIRCINKLFLFAFCGLVFFPVAGIRVGNYDQSAFLEAVQLKDSHIQDKG